MLKIGLIAQGVLGRYYGRLIKEKIKNATLIAASSPNSNDLDFLRYELEVNQNYRDHTRLLELNELDAIVICGDPAYHADYITDSLTANFHVFCEKPMSLSNEESQKVIEQANRRPSQLCKIGFERRYDKAYLQAKAEIESGKIGDAYLMQSHTLASIENNIGSAEFKSQGIFFDQALGDIDSIGWLLESQFDNVIALGHNNPNDIKSVIASCQLKDGKLAQLTVCKMRPSGFHSGAEIFGSEGSILIKDETSHIRTYSASGISFQRHLSSLDRFSDAYELQMQSFVNSILNKDKFVNNCGDAAGVTKSALRMLDSLKT